MGRYVVYRGELYHHGILGMKWGVRRFQNEDGTLTPAGKKRLRKYVDPEKRELTPKGERKFGIVVRSTAYEREVKRNKNDFRSENDYKKYKLMARRMKQIDQKNLSPKKKAFLKEVLKNVDIDNYETLMDISEIEEDYDMHYADKFPDYGEDYYDPRSKRWINV